MVQELHRHDFYYILALQKGSGTHDIDFSPCTVCDNVIFLLRPGQVHRLILKAGSTGYVMQFKNEFYNPRDKASNQQLRKAGNINHYQPGAGRFQKLFSLLTYIFEEYTGKQENYGEVIKANIRIFFIELARLYNYSLPVNTDLYIQQRLEEFLDLLETNVFNHKQVSYYAAVLNLSEYQLNSITKATVGQTCSEIINDAIILEAKRYVLGTSYQVKEIADHLGYEDVSYFIRFFKKHTGFSPNEFRNNFT
jgi:AraC-like DNA-binding protein